VGYERRNGGGGNNQVITASLNGKLTPALTGLVRFNQASAANAGLTRLGDTALLRLGLAYRDPQDDRLNALLRYEYRKNPATIPDTLLIGSSAEAKDHLFGLEAIYAPDWRWEFFGKYAIRSTRTMLARDFRSESHVSLSQMRATYRLGYRMDIVGEARWVEQPGAGYDSFGFVLEGGYYVTPNLRLAAGYSLGRVDDRDLDTPRRARGVYVGATLKLNELFRGTGLPARSDESRRAEKRAPRDD
jgi:hypothetical protein